MGKLKLVQLCSYSVVKLHEVSQIVVTFDYVKVNTYKEVW